MNTIKYLIAVATPLLIVGLALTYERRVRRYNRFWGRVMDEREAMAPILGTWLLLGAILLGGVALCLWLLGGR